MTQLDKQQARAVETAATRALAALTEAMRCDLRDHLRVHSCLTTVEVELKSIVKAVQS